MVRKQSSFSFLTSNRLPALLASLLTIMLFITQSATLHAASVTASLNKNAVTENEVVQLTLRADFSDTGNGPDLTPLERDFEILGKSQNSQFSFNLGTSTALNFWVVSLMPKSVGTVEIPAIKIGNYESQPIRLVVRNAPQLMDSNGNPPVLMRMDVSEIEPYLQQEVILSVQLFTSVSLQNANRSVPSHPDLVIERLIDDQVDYQTVNGTEYQVITRDYLVFPQRSGVLTIPPQSIQAMVNTSTGRRMVKVQSEPLRLQVLPIPASYTGDNWLPSSDVSIATELTATSDTPKVGDTLIWTIDIRAKGALPEQIPLVSFNSTRDYKLYPQPPKFDTQKNASGVTGIQTITIEVVPTTEGSLTLPEIDIIYWDTEERIMRTAKRATQAMTIAALPSNSGNNSASNRTSVTNQPLPAQPRSVAPISLAKKPLETEETPMPSPANVDIALTQTSGDFSLRHYLVAGLFLFALVMIGVWSLLWFKRKKDPVDDEAQVPTLQEFAPLSTQNETSAYQALVDCCQQNQLHSLRPILLEWARHRWGDEEIRSVDDIKRLTSVQITQLLMEAELMMYSNNPAHEWHGEPLAEALEEFTSGQARPSQASQLKTLYPNF